MSTKATETKPSTLVSHGRRVARVTQYIAAHLNDPLDVETLAAVAHFSPWHFHRVYRETTGETIGDAVRRLRLHRAAAELIRGDASLDRVAHRAGYGSLAAFSRAFAADYGVPPGEYRRREKSVDLPDQSRPPREITAMYDVTIEPFGGARLAAVAHRGDYQAIGTAFERVFAWAASRGLLGPASRMIGIYYDDPQSVPTAELRSHAGVTVTRDADESDGVRIIDMPPQLCASVVHKGPYAELERAYAFLFRDWLAQSGREPADHPCFEEYLNNPRDLPPTEWLTRIYLPIKP